MAKPQLVKVRALFLYFLNFYIKRGCLCILRHPLYTGGIMISLRLLHYHFVRLAVNHDNVDAGLKSSNLVVAFVEGECA